MAEKTEPGRIEQGIAWLGKVISEEIQKATGELHLIRTALESLMIQIKRMCDDLEGIHANTSSMDESNIKQESYLEDIKASSFLTETEFIKWKQKRGEDD